MQDFIGLDNYARILHDRVFLQGAGNNLLIVRLSVVVQLPLALGLALLIRQNLRGRTVFRVIFFLPYVLSEVITGVIWSFIYNPQSGPAQQRPVADPRLQAAGLAGRHRIWCSSRCSWSSPGSTSGCT